MGTTSQKLTYLNETKGKLKDSINKFRNGITNQTTFRNYATELDGIYDLLPKVDNISDASQLLNAQNGLVDDFKMYGNTSQTTYTGKNLFDADTIIPISIGSRTYITYDSTNKSFTFTVQETSSHNYFPIDSGTSYINNIEINVLQNTDYTFSFSRTSNETRIAIYGVNSNNGYTRITSFDTSDTLTFNTSTYTEIAVRFDVTASAGTNITFSNLQLELGASKTDYEPYVGGTASPNPDYPQNVNVVTGTQTINVCGKNLIGLGTQLNGYRNVDTGKFQGNSSSIGYYFETSKLPNTITFNCTGGNRANISYYNETPTTGVNSQDYSRVNDLPRTINVNKEYTYIHIQFSYNETNVTNIQVEEGSTASDWEAYKEQNFTINLGSMELCEINTYEDEIKKSTGKNLFNGELELGNYDNETGAKGYSTSSYRNVNPLEIEPNTTYIFSIDGVGKALNVYEYKADMTYIGKITGAVITAGTSFTTGSQAKYICFFRGNADGNEKWQIEKSSIITDYEPYGKVWYKKAYINKIILNGSEDGWNKGSSATTRSVYSNNTFTDRLSSTSQKDFVSDKFSYLGNAQLTDLGYAMSFNSQYNSRYLYIQVPLNVVAYDHLDDFKTWLSTHNTTVYYVLATPTITKITDTTLISQLENIAVFTGTNHFTISNSNNALPSVYVKRLKNLNNLS